jgi:hypothetical protein
MPLHRGRDLGFDFDRTAYKFTMFNQGREIRFVVSAEAMDDLERASNVSAAERDAQFERLRETIESVAERKFFILSEESRESETEFLIRSQDVSKFGR